MNAVAIAAIVALGGVALLFKLGSSEGQVPAITPANVHSLSMAWTANVGAGPSSPVIEGDEVFVLADDRLFAFPLECGRAGSSCSPLWTAAVGPGSTEVPAVVDGVVVVTSPSGLLAFDVGCGRDGESCSPLWTAPAPPVVALSGDPFSQEHQAPPVNGYSGPAGAADSVYVSGPGGLWVFAARCGATAADASLRGAGSAKAGP